MGPECPYSMLPRYLGSFVTLGFSHTRLKTKLQPIYDPNLWESYVNHRNRERLVAEVVDDRTSKLGRDKVSEHVQNFSTAILTRK